MLTRPPETQACYHRTVRAVRRCRFPAMTPPGDPTQLTLTELGAAYRARQLSPVDATRACLDRIARLEPELHAFITVTGELALDQARAAEAELARGRDRGPLHGVPI